jgi:hypothetical protein
MQETVIESASVDDLFSGASQIYVGVVSGGKPHVTPELLATGEGRLWCLTAAVTHKVKKLVEDERVAFYASTERGDVIGIGRASIVDPLKPGTLSNPLEVARSAIGATRFVARNAAELTGAVVDGAAGKLGRPLPPHRVVVSIEPIALARDSADGVEAWGHWETAAAPEDEESGAEDASDLTAPEDVRSLLDDGPAALGWLSGSGHPLVLPARWNKEESTARVTSRLFTCSGAVRESPAAVTRDKWTGYGPLGKQGVMLRGDAAVTTAGSDAAAVVTVDRVTYWDGIETGTAATN